MEQTSWLVFECLDLNAVILLNGQEIGRHANAHRPARFDVTGKLRSGENFLVVKIESGLFANAEKPGYKTSGRPDYGNALLTKRPWQRKPQYQFGWDWNPRLINVGILGDVRLEWQNTPRLDQVTVFAVPDRDLSFAQVHVRAMVEGCGEKTYATLRASLMETGQEIELPVEIEPGMHRHEVTLPIAQPRLWWPIHHGEQFRYTVKITLETNGQLQTAVRKTGVRLVEIDQSAHPSEGRYCILKINHRSIFCKGGNWAPADMLYNRVSETHYRELINLAVQANFNIIRINAVGLYADHALCEACDEAGIMIWHDFLFTCAKFPDNDPVFANEVRREIL